MIISYNLLFNVITPNTFMVLNYALGLNCQL